MLFYKYELNLFCGLMHAHCRTKNTGLVSYITSRIGSERTSGGICSARLYMERLHWNLSDMLLAITYNVKIMPLKLVCVYLDITSSVITLQFPSIMADAASHRPTILKSPVISLLVT